MQKISFSEHYMLTTAVLNRTKEMTRRLEKALERAVAEYEKQYGEPFEIITQYWDEKRKKVCCLTKHGIIHVGTHYKLNEVVAVAQSYEDIYIDITDDLEWFKKVEDAHGGKDYCLLAGTDNKMFVKAVLMPHQIKITGVRIERLQAISDEDCLKEGVTYDSRYWVNGYKVAGLWNKNQRQSHWRSPREAFAALINRPGVGRKGLWHSNPWVVVYEFKLVK